MKFFTSSSSPLNSKIFTFLPFGFFAMLRFVWIALFFLINLLLLQHWNFFNFFFSLHSLTYSILQASWFHVFQPNFAHELAYLCKLSLEAVKMSEYLISAPSRMRFWLVFMEFRGFSSFFSLHFTPSAFLPYSSVVRMGEFPTTNQTNAIENRPFWEIIDAVLVNFGDRRQRRHLSRDCNYVKWKLFAIYYINSTFALTMKFFSSQVWRCLSHFCVDVTLSVSVQLMWIGWIV